MKQHIHSIFLFVESLAAILDLTPFRLADFDIILPAINASHE